MTAEGKSKKVAEHAAAEKGLKLLETYSFGCSTTSPFVGGNFALPVVVGRQQESQNSSSSSKAAATFSKNEVGGLSSELQQMLQQSKVQQEMHKKALDQAQAAGTGGSKRQEDVSTVTEPKAVEGVAHAAPSPAPLQAQQSTDLVHSETQADLETQAKFSEESDDFIVSSLSEEDAKAKLVWALRENKKLRAQQQAERARKRFAAEALLATGLGNALFEQSRNAL